MEISSSSFSRMANCQDQVFRDPVTGDLYEGLRYISIPNEKAVDLMDNIEVWYHQGQIHRDQDHAVAFPDGHKEEWKHGKFIRVSEPAFVFRT